jgi:D-alanine--poly(phosphoribitol) ligase subunit 1
MKRPAGENDVLSDIVDRAVQHPGDLAIQDAERELSYAQLADEVERLAGDLHVQGVKEGDRVALLMANSADFVVAALATLWVGAIFVPLAPTDPPARVADIVEDCAPALILTSKRQDVSMDASIGVRARSIEELSALGDGHHAPRANADAAYMIYTSGTTGTPKGVLVSNAAFARALRPIIDSAEIDRSTRTLCVSPFHFDGSYGNLFATLVVGGSLFIRSRDSLLFPRVFFNTVASERVTFSSFTPSYLRVLLSSSQFSDLYHSTLRTIALGGEAITMADLRELWRQAPSLRVINRYGPTETTIAVTNHELTPDILEAGVVPIGRPNPGVVFVMIGSDGSIIEDSGVPGELFIGGAQLMEGYWGNAELTDSVMRDDVIAGERFYRSGDLVYRATDGTYVYMDRLDRVLKRSGVRISLVELNAVLSQLPEVIAAACVTFDDEGTLGIAAFVTAPPGVTPTDVRRAAASRIPLTMLPDRFEIVSALPLNRSNQLDEVALRASVGLAPYRPQPECGGTAAP